MSAVTGLVTLSTPITLKLRSVNGDVTEEQISELVIRKPVAGDLRAMDAYQGESEAMIGLLAFLTGQPFDTIGGVKGVDFQALVMKLNAMKADGWPAGSKSSLTVREPFARDLMVMDRHQGQNSKLLALVAHLAGVDIARVDALEIGEFEALRDGAQGFTPPGPSTGETA